MDEREKLVVEPPIYKTTLVRFYIMTLMAVYNFLSMFYFDSWQPIMESLSSVFKWSLTSINLLPNVYALIYVILIVPFVIIWNKTTIRHMVIINMFFMVFGVVIRVYYTSINKTAILIHFSNLFIAMSSILALVIPPVISAVWFPYYERSMATAFMFSMREFGNALTPLLTPYAVPDMNLTKDSLDGMKLSYTKVRDTLLSLNEFFYIECLVTILIFFVIIIYFPSRPKQLPSKSSDEFLRISFYEGFKKLYRMKDFWIIFILNFIIYGIQTGIGLVYTSTVTELGLSQRQAGISNFVNVMSITISVLVGGYLGEKYQYKTLINVFIFPHFLLYLLYGLQIMKIIPYDLVSIYILNITREFLCSTLDPILYEMACEAAFPINEVIVCSVLGISSNLGTSLFLSISMIPGIGIYWIPFFYCFIVIWIWPLIRFYDDTKRRRQVDLEEDNKIDEK